MAKAYLHCGKFYFDYEAAEGVQPDAQAYLFTGKCPVWAVLDRGGVALLA